jgi:hypothetical protein
MTSHTFTRRDGTTFDLAVEFQAQYRNPRIGRHCWRESSGPAVRLSTARERAAAQAEAVGDGTYTRIIMVAARPAERSKLTHIDMNQRIVREGATA